MKHRVLDGSCTVTRPIGRLLLANYKPLRQSESRSIGVTIPPALTAVEEERGHFRKLAVNELRR
jgi:hypothetical protein